MTGCTAVVRDGERVLAGCFVASIGTAQPEEFEVAHQVAVAVAWLGVIVAATSSA